MIIILIGLTLKNIVPTNVATNNRMLMENCQAFSLGVEKFSFVQSNKVAAANNPTTAGRSPLNSSGVHILQEHLANQNHQYQRWQNEGKSSCQRAKNAHWCRVTCINHRLIAAIRSRINTDGTWSHLTNSDNIRKLRWSEPLPMLNRFILDEWKHSIAPTKAEDPYREECNKQIKEYHFSTTVYTVSYHYHSVGFIIVPYK